MINIHKLYPSLVHDSVLCSVLFIALMQIDFIWWICYPFFLYTQRYISLPAGQGIIGQYPSHVHPALQMVSSIEAVLVCGVRHTNADCLVPFVSMTTMSSEDVLPCWWDVNVSRPSVARVNDVAVPAPCCLHNMCAVLAARRTRVAVSAPAPCGGAAHPHPRGPAYGKLGGDDPLSSGPH